MAVVGALMVARFGTPSFKKITVHTDSISFVVLGFVVLVAALFAYPWQTLAIMDATYLTLLIWELVRRKPKSA
jgi:CDP-diacylglycerol--serine O-phosphatidyltransferase